MEHVISADGVMPDPAKTKTKTNICQYPAPTNLKKLQSFLGQASYRQKFIQGFSELAQSLRVLLQKEAKSERSPSCQEAFRCLKDK